MTDTSSRLPALTLLHGEDEFAISERVDSLKRRQGAGDAALLNITELDGGDLVLEELRSICDTMPFLAGQRLVIVHNVFGRLKTADDRNSNRRDIVSGLIGYLPHLSPFCSLVLVAAPILSGDSRKRKTMLLEAVNKVHGADIQLYSIATGDDLLLWIMHRAVASGGEFSRQAAGALARAHPGRPRVLQGEIDKLLSYVGWQRPVSASDVELLTSVTYQANIFHLVDAVAQRNGRLATAQLHCLLEQEGHAPIQVFGMIVRQYRLLLQAKEILSSGGSKRDVQTRLKLHPFAAEKVVTQSRGYSLRWLETNHYRMLTLDIAMKKGADQKTSLDLLVCGLSA